MLIKSQNGGVVKLTDVSIDCSWTSRLVPDTGYYPEVEALLGRLLLTKRSNTSQFPHLACFPSEAENLSTQTPPGFQQTGKYH